MQPNTLTDILIDSRDTNITHSPIPNIEELQEVFCKIILAGSKKLSKPMIITLRNSIKNYIIKKNKENINEIVLNIFSPIFKSLYSRLSRIGASASDLLINLRPLKIELEGNRICLIDYYININMNKLAEHLFNIDQRIRRNMVILLEKYQRKIIDEIPLSLLYRNLSRSDPSSLVRKEVIKRMILDESICKLCKEGNKNMDLIKHTPNSSLNCLIAAINDDNLSVRIAVINRLNEVSIKHLSKPRRLNLLKRCFTERNFNAKTQLINIIKLEYTYKEIIEDFCDVSIEYIEKLSTFTNINKIENDLFNDTIKVNQPDLIYSNTTKHLIDLLFEIFQEIEYILPETTNFNDLFLLRVYNEYLINNDQPLILPNSKNICKEVINICQFEGIEDSQDFLLKTLRTLELFKIAYFYNSYDPEAKNNLLKSVKQLLSHHCKIFFDKKCPNKLQLYSNFIYLLFIHAVSLLYKWDSGKILMQIIAKFISSSSYNTALLNLYKIILEINKNYELKNNEEIQKLSNAVYDEGVRPFLEKKIQNQKKIDFSSQIVIKEINYGIKSMQTPLIKKPNLIKETNELTISQINKKINYNLLLHCYFLYEPIDFTILPLIYKTDLYLMNKINLTEYKKYFEFEINNINLACKVLIKISCNSDELISNKSENMEFIYSLIHFLLDMYFNNEDNKNIIHVFWFEYSKISNFHLHILPIYTNYLENNKKIKNYTIKSLKALIDLMMLYSGVLNVLLFFMIYWNNNQSAFKETIERALVFLEEFKPNIENKNLLIHIDQLEEILPKNIIKNSYIDKLQSIEIILGVNDNLKIKILQIIATKLTRKIKDDSFSKLYFQISRMDDGHVSEKLTNLIRDLI